MQQNISTLFRGACVALCLLAVETRAWEAPLPAGKGTRIAAPRMATPPVIDGTIDADEWAGAAAISGVGGCMDNRLVSRPTLFWIGWDAEHIYIASRVWVRPGYKPKVGGREPGAATVFDDSFEFHWLPKGRNVPDGRTDSSYKWVVNSLGFDGDLYRVSVGQQFRNWLPQFRIATHLSETGTAPLGGRWLDMEMATRWEDFELAGPHRAGDTWNMMLGVNHLFVGWYQARIPATSSYLNPDGYPVIELVENAPTVQFRLDGYPMPNEGTLDGRWEVRNPSDKPVEVTLLAEITVPRDQNEEIVRIEKTLKLAPGASETVPLQADFAEKLAGRQGGLHLLAMTGSDVLYRQFNYFNPGIRAESREPAAAPEHAFPLELGFNPVRNTLEIKADAYYLDDPSSAAAVNWLIRPKGGKALREGRIEKAVLSYFIARETMEDLAPGDYEIEATMEMRDGTRRGPETIDFVKKDEAAEFPEWWNTKLGSTERVIYPFTPITVADGTLSPWGRDYCLNTLGLPEKIVSQGKPVTAGNARIVATVDGREIVIPLDGAPELTEVKDWRVRFRGKAEGAGLALQAEGWLEQDGLVQVSLTYGPQGEPVTVDALRLEFPLSGVEGETLLCIGPGGNYSARTTMLLPKAGSSTLTPGPSPKGRGEGEQKGRLWTTLDTGLNGAQMTVGSFYPSVWVGNEQRGLLWYADSDRGWVPDNDVPAHELWRQGEDLVLRNNIIGKPFTLDAPRTLVFTYMASPFRPNLKNRRAMIYSENGTFDGPNKKQKDANGKVIVDGWAWLTPPSTNPDQWSAMWAGYKEIADARIRRLQWREPATARNKYGSTVHTSLPLMGYDWKTPDKRVTDYFGPDWADGSDSWNKSEQDYFLYIADRAFREGGLRTLYWDIFFHKSFKKPLAGVGYELPDGRIQPEYNGLNIRRFMMRMYGLLGDHSLTPGGQVTHATNGYLLPAMGWTDAVLDGEFHSLGDDSTKDWVDGYPIDRMRAMSVSGMFGNQVTWMALIKISDRRKSGLVWRGLKDYTRMYDTWRDWNELWMPPFDWGLNEMEYAPFWRNPHIPGSDDQVLVSAWTMPGRVILAAFNYDANAVRSSSFSLDLEALGLTVKTPWAGGVVARGLQGVSPEFDPLTGRLNLREIQPRTGAVIALRAVEQETYDHLLGALRQAAGALPEAQKPGVVPDALLNFGLADAKVAVRRDGDWGGCADPALTATCLQLPDRILIAIANPGPEARDAVVQVNLDTLGLVPELQWQEFVQERDFGPVQKGKEAKLDFHARSLSVPGIAPGTVRLVAIRRY